MPNTCAHFRRGLPGMWIAAPPQGGPLGAPLALGGWRQDYIVEDVDDAVRGIDVGLDDLCVAVEVEAVPFDAERDCLLVEGSGFVEGDCGLGESRLSPWGVWRRPRQWERRP